MERLDEESPVDLSLKGMVGLTNRAQEVINAAMKLAEENQKRIKELEHKPTFPQIYRTTNPTEQTPHRPAA